MQALHRKPILVGPCGSGKTQMGVEIARRLNARVLWIAHRRELIDQAYKALAKRGLSVGVIMAGEPSNSFARFQVASVQTLNRRAMPPCDLVVIDECHRATADSYRDVLDLPVPTIGLTATPFRLDGKPLSDMFDEIVVAAQVRDLIEQGWLHEPIVYSWGQPDLSRVKVTAGEYNMAQVDRAVNRPTLIGNIVREWRRRADGKRTVCFAVNVKHSMRIVEAFRGAGVSAEHLDGGMSADQRDAILARLASGETLVVSNCMVLTEGWDLPALECCIAARPTESLNLHIQMIGRVVRAAEGKSGAIVLDHAGNHHRHGPITRRLEYSLGGTVRVAVGEPLGMRRCPACQLMCEMTATQCPECGEVFEAIAAKLQTADGDLEQFEDQSFEYRHAWWSQVEAERQHWKFKLGWSTQKYEERFGERPVIVEQGDGWRLVDVKNATQDDKREVYASLLRFARERGMKDGWASHRYRAAFGVWPTGFVKQVRGEAVADELTERWRERVAV